MSSELQFFPIPLLILTFGILVYALVLRIRLWFYQSIIKSFKDLIPAPSTPAHQSGGISLGGCLTSLAISVVLFIVFISLLAI